MLRVCFISNRLRPSSAAAFRSSRNAGRPSSSIALAALLFCQAASLAGAADGDLDTSFGTSGKTSVSFGASDIPYTAYLQSDGKMLVAGGVRPGSFEDFGVARFTLDGAADTGFGTSGKFSTNLSIATTQTDRATAVGVQSDGSIILSGYTRSVSASNDFAVIRLSSAGARDTTFNGNTGLSQTDFFSGSDSSFSMRVQADNKIVLAGQSLNSGNATLSVLRLNADGTVDTSFGTSGKATKVIGTTQTTPNAMAIDADGKILIGGITNGPALPSSSNYYAFLCRFNSNGTIDTTFGTNGVLTFNTTGATSDSLYGIAVQSDGKIVACGFSYVGASNGWVARFTTSGAFDSTFNTAGIRLMDFGGSTDQLFCLALQSDGKIVAGGSYINSSNTYDSVLVRLTSTGALDTSFAGGGINKVALHSDKDKIVGIGLQSSSKIVAAIEFGPTSSDDFGVARFLNTAADSTPPTIESIVRLSPTGQSISGGTTSVTFRVTYSEAVQNVTTAEFAIEAVNGSSITGSVASVSGTGNTRDVAANITGGFGEFRLKVVQ